MNQVIPASIVRDGYLSLAEAVRPTGTKYRRLLVGTDGAAGTGKTEFILSAPGPGMVVVIDRGIDSLTNNPNPPATRRSDFGIKIMKPPAFSAATQNDFVLAWREFRDEVYRAIANPDCRTVGIDSDSDSWEMQRLADFGKLAQVSPHLYVGVNAARRAFYSRLWDSGRIIIATNKIKKEYEAVMDVQGQPVMKDGKEKREWTGQYERQGFQDRDFLFQVQMTHLYKPPSFNPILKRDIAQQFGMRITSCKANRSLEGSELWNDESNFAGLVSYIYPHIPLSDWGL